MPKIKLKRDDKIEQVLVTKETLERILFYIEDKNFKATHLVNVDGLNFQKRDFRGFVQEADTILTDGYDISNSDHRQELLKFKEELDNFKAITNLTKPLEYYGDSLPTNEEWDKKNLGKGRIKSEDRQFTTEKGYVNNPILGIVHFSEVLWAEEQGLIGRYTGGNWFIALDPTAQKQMATARKFDLFSAKRKALKQMLEYQSEHNKEEEVKLEGVEF